MFLVYSKAISLKMGLKKIIYYFLQIFLIGSLSKRNESKHEEQWYCSAKMIMS